MSSPRSMGRDGVRPSGLLIENASRTRTEFARERARALCHVKRSRDISGYFFEEVRDRHLSSVVHGREGSARRHDLGVVPT